MAERRSLRVDWGWQWPWTVHEGAGGTHLPAVWVAEEFPELAPGRQLPPIAEYYGLRPASMLALRSNRMQLGKSSPWTAGLIVVAAMVIPITLLILVSGQFGRLVTGIAYLVLPASVGWLLWRITTTLRRLRHGLPQTPVEVLNSRNRDFVQDLLLTPVTARELFLAEWVRIALRPKLFRIRSPIPYVVAMLLLSAMLWGFGYLEPKIRVGVLVFYPMATAALLVVNPSRGSSVRYLFGQLTGTVLMARLGRRLIPIGQLTMVNLRLFVVGMLDWVVVVPVLVLEVVLIIGAFFLPIPWLWHLLIGTATLFLACSPPWHRLHRETRMAARRHLRLFELAWRYLEDRRREAFEHSAEMPSLSLQ